MDFFSPIVDERAARELIRMVEGEGQRGPIQIPTMTPAALTSRNLDFASYSIQYVYLLAQMAEDEVNRVFWATKTSELLQKFNSAFIHLAARMFGILANKYADYLIAENKAMSELKTFALAVQRLQRAPGQLTPLHPIFLKLCLKTHHYNYAAELLQEPITSIMAEDRQMDVLGVLLFFYYGGLVHVGLKAFDAAIQCFSAVLCAPTEKSISAVAVAAYQKLILVSLIKYGEIVPLPKVTANTLRNIRVLCQPYNELVSAFTAGSVPAFDRAVERGRAQLEAHHSLGLVSQCRRALLSSKIQQLTKVYLTLSLTDLAKRVGLPGPAEALELLLVMIADGSINAQIDQHTDLVSFGQAGEQFETVETLAALDAKITNSAKLYERIRSLDSELRVTRAYVSKANNLDTSGVAGLSLTGETADMME
eukprot:m.137944 g.137944  ORF g.137944 m.137944 type:complete len:423 (+) comp14913_c0_seq1:1098-2366(+)